MEKENLGIEFYRNYIGIEKPLRLDFGNPDGSTIGFDYIDSTDNENQISAEEYWWSYGDIKPHLKLPEDLTRKELLFVFGDTIPNIDNDRISLTRNGTGVGFWDDETTKDFNWLSVDGIFLHCNQEILNRLYSLHSHPKAKEYIENGLAIKIEVKDEKQ